ncbi:hypothetical protein SAMN04489712_104181 [Thermomonospora echinospora]|uniref:Uncharacterized protein n=1 Tax=Thermomonospora echinospora TaxID=1992 RepID=A0A1H5YWB6_9ACTN|nr:hypothetical protein [Thermomonospora echinospora]SEG27496.1 hypothetical protein SAMN04489712_104181 [Thermomonospora echinospora]
MILIIFFASVLAVFLVCVACLIGFALVSRRDSLTIPTADKAGARRARRAAGVYILRREPLEQAERAMPAALPGK